MRSFAAESCVSSKSSAWMETPLAKRREARMAFIPVPMMLARISLDPNDSTYFRAMRPHHGRRSRQRQSEPVQDRFLAQLDDVRGNVLVFRVDDKFRRQIW